VIGSWISTASPIVAELMAGMGFDFLAVDAEHSAVDVPQVQGLFQAIRSGSPDCAPLVRLPDGVYASVKRYLDAGAAGVIAPLINTPQQAREVVGAVKYPPLGGRGVGFCRDNAYGNALDRVVPAANERTVIVVQIEHVEGVQNIDAILSVGQIDAVFIGPYDLSASMGIVGQFDHPRMVEARQRIVSACKDHGVAAGIHVIQPDADEAGRRIEQGYRMIAYSLDITMLSQACRRGLEGLRPRLGR
jgi:2-dehydro-3-deoxyglucarate aldolase